ncbi:MAG: SAM-dependent methyltransferase, partial [Deltaproteobacteria bacterium]|nr:SAM-dependent methyltransferase [Deltaproteobacteria bacterium]
MTTLADIVRRPQPPTAWAEGDNIPWNDPSFSERMLREHLNQDHDLASRRIEKIERHVAWIH